MTDGMCINWGGGLPECYPVGERMQGPVGVGEGALTQPLLACLGVMMVSVLEVLGTPADLEPLAAMSRSDVAAGAVTCCNTPANRATPHHMVATVHGGTATRDVHTHITG